MLKEAIEKIVQLAENRIHMVNGEQYTEKPLTRIAPYVPKPEPITVRGLDSLITLLLNEPKMAMLFVEVVSYGEVSVYTSLLGDDFRRNYLYTAKLDTPKFTSDWRDYESAIIAIRSRFIQDEQTESVLKLLSQIVDENSVATTDNGLSQTVEIRKGVALKEKAKVNPIVKLRPYRTFLEVEQPQSEFLLRLGEGGAVGLFEADGGMWQLTAKRTIAEYLRFALSGHDDIIVMS